MNDNSAELQDFFSVDVDEKSEALRNLDRTAILGISTLAVVAIVVFSLIFFAL